MNFIYNVCFLRWIGACLLFACFCVFATLAPGRSKLAARYCLWHIFVDGGQFFLCVKFKYSVLVIKRGSSGLGRILPGDARPAGFDEE